jgi:cell wall assembly regulator SMI1
MRHEHSDLTTSWQRIEAYLWAHAPQVAATLGPPATADQIVAVEVAIGRQLPIDLAASLRIHNGQSDPTQLWSFTECGHLLDCNGIVEMWRMTESVHAEEVGRPPPVPDVDYTPPAWWRSTLVPFTFDEGEMLCADTDPDLGPAQGAIVMHIHDYGLSEPLARDFRAWLAAVATKLEAGALIVEQGYSYLRSETRPEGAQQG